MTLMTGQGNTGRRRFLRAGLWGTAAAAAGGGLGWIVTHRPAGRNTARPASGSGAPAWTKIDPALLVARPAGTLAVAFDRPRRLLATRGGRIVLAGDSSVHVLDASGATVAKFDCPAPPTCLAEDDDKRLFIGCGNRVLVSSSGEKPPEPWTELGARSHLTSIAPAGDAVFLADAGNREIVRCARDGRAQAPFGRRDPAAGNPGFVIPSPYFDIAAGADGLLHAANTGRHRVETYSLDGRFQGAWGAASMTPEGFCGCCNPVYFKLLPGGRYLTSEKGLTRVKIHGPDGALRGVVAGPEQLAVDPDVAARVASDCRTGCGFDVACDSSGRVLVLDAKARLIRVFESLI